jgi:hypothetical protein
MLGIIPTKRLSLVRSDEQRQIDSNSFDESLREKQPIA